MEPYRTTPEGAPLCPRCRTPLAQAEHETDELLGCVSCGGFFVDLETLARIVERHRPAPSPNAPASLRGVAKPPLDTRVVYLPCPHCGATMNRGIFGRKSGVIVDTCRVHGTWFDAHELEACEAYVEAGGIEIAERYAREEKARALRDARVASQSQFVVNRPSSRGMGQVEDRDWDRLIDILTRL